MPTKDTLFSTLFKAMLVHVTDHLGNVYNDFSSSALEEKMAKIFITFLIWFTVSFTPQSALATGFDNTTFMLQTVLNDHGFSVGAPDGKIGPATRKGLTDFAKYYGTSSDPQEVMNFIMALSYTARKNIDNEVYLENVKAELAENLRDPSSVMIRDVFKIESYVCGQVNGKNAYGAYAGYTWFLGLEVFGGFSVGIIDSLTDFPSAKFRCLMAFPKSKAVGQ